MRVVSTASSPSPDPGAPQRGTPRTRRVAALRSTAADCVWCRRRLTVGWLAPSVEHVVPRLRGGPPWPENELLACCGCNRARGHRSASLWIDLCRARGLEPDVPRVLAALRRLESAVEERGGSRKARPYLERELRRVTARLGAGSEEEPGGDRRVRGLGAADRVSPGPS